MGKKPRFEFDHIEFYGSIGPRKFTGYSQYTGEMSDLVEVMLHSQLGEGYEIARLGKLEDMIDRFRKYDVPHPTLNYDLAEKAIDTFLTMIPKCGVMTYEEAFERLDLSKSIGLGAKTDKVFSRQDPLIHDYLKGYIDIASKQNVFCLINGSQKDEVRVVGKTPRFFTSFPPEHTLTATMALGEFFDHFVTNSFAACGLPSAVGDPLQSGAMAYYKEQLERLPYWYCTDTSAQDSSVSSEFMELVYDKIKEKIRFPDEVYEGLFENVRFNSINKLIHINGELYVCPRGLGSGDYLTIVINILWRYYMILENYNHDLSRVLIDNVIIINGDDLVMSSKFSDLNLNSVHAKIEWAGKPIPKEEADFCSLMFYPYIHHSKDKVLAVYKLRKMRNKSYDPESEAQRIAGLMRCLVDYNTYCYLANILSMMHDDGEISYEVYSNCFVSFQEVYDRYNNFLVFSDN